MRGLEPKVLELKSCCSEYSVSCTIGRSDTDAESSSAAVALHVSQMGNRLQARRQSRMTTYGPTPVTAMATPYMHA